jgi:hypothetical protein
MRGGGKFFNPQACAGHLGPSRAKLVNNFRKMRLVTKIPLWQKECAGLD